MHEASDDGYSKVFGGEIYIVEARNTHAESTSHTEKKIIAAICIKNLIIVDTSDGPLVAERSKTQDVKQVVKALKAGAEAEFKVLSGIVRRP